MRMSFSVDPSFCLVTTRTDSRHCGQRDKDPVVGILLSHDHTQHFTCQIDAVESGQTTTSARRLELSYVLIVDLYSWKHEKGTRLTHTHIHTVYSIITLLPPVYTSVHSVY